MFARNFCLCGLLVLAHWATVEAQSTKALSKQLGIDEGLVKQILLRRDMTPEQLAKVPKSLLPRMARRLALPELQRDRARFRNSQYEDAQGLIPRGALLKAAEDFRTAQNRTTKNIAAGIPVGKSNTKRIQPLTAGLEGAGWVWKGPGNIGGRTRTLMVHPTSHNILLAGSVGGGAWFTLDRGEKWHPVDDFLSNLVITSLVYDPANINTLYAGTGEGYGGGFLLRGAGIFKSTLGVNDWKQLPSTNNSNFDFVNRLAITPAGTRLYAATNAGLFASINGGESWAKVIDEPMGCVAVHPTDNRKAVAGAMNSGVIYYTSNGGLTWNVSTKDELVTGRVEVVYATADPNVVYAGAESGKTQIMRSSDGGKTFEMRNNNQANIYNGQGWYNNVLWAGDPNNANFLIVGGLDLYRSFNGGATMTPMSVWWNEASIHADHHVIVPHPKFNGTTNKTVFFANDGGIYRTDDVYTAGNDESQNRGNGWTKLNNNYGVTQFYHGAGNPETGIIEAGAQDNGTLRFTPQGGTGGWTRPAGGDGGWCAFDPTDVNVFYSEYVFLEIQRSLDNSATVENIVGKYWTGAEWAYKDPPYVLPDSRDRRALFIAPFEVDPNRPSRILAGGASLWRTDDAKTPNTNTTGPQWKRIKAPINATPEPLISSISISPESSNRVWLAYHNGQLFRSDNAAMDRPNWHDKSAGLPQNRWCHHVLIDPRRSHVVYATFGGFNTGNVWRTINSGATWDNISSGLPAVPVRSLAIHPKKGDYLYIGTEVGVFASENGGQTWSPTNEGPANTSVDHLFWMNETLVAVTHGRGVFSIDLSGVGQ